MPDTIVCPHCKGTGVNYIITHDGSPNLHSVKCGVCGGDGRILDGNSRDGTITNSASEGELWPILVPLGVFFLFFAFLLV
jgi:DnaJ-class molecular chaperone